MTWVGRVLSVALLAAALGTYLSARAERREQLQLLADRLDIDAAAIPTGQPVETWLGRYWKERIPLGTAVSELERQRPIWALPVQAGRDLMWTLGGPYWVRFRLDHDEVAGLVAGARLMSGRDVLAVACVWAALLSAVALPAIGRRRGAPAADP